MAIWIKIRKLFENSDVGYYQVYSQDYVTVEFYMAINRPLQHLEFYYTDDFSNIAKVIDCSKGDSLIGPFPGVNEINFIKAFGKGLKALKMNDFPESLDFAA